MAPNTKDKWVRRFLITETTRHKKGFTVYKVTSVIYPKSAPEAVSRVSIWKRYNEFRKLHSELSSRHDSLRIKEKFPSFPKPKFFGRFEAEVIEERRRCAIKLLEFIGRHTALFTSNVFVKFFESGQSTDSITTDCSLSLSSDTSEDDYNINHALRGTNYTPTPFYDTEINTDSRIPEALFTENQNSKDINSDEYTTDESGINIQIAHTKTDHLSLDLTPNNNYVEKINPGIEEIGQTELNENKNKGQLHSDTEFPLSNQNHSTKLTSSLVKDSPDLENEINGEFGSYILLAAAHMSAASKHEAIGEFAEAFTQYKLGISKLLDQVQSDPDLDRRITVKGKISKYLERAEKLYNRHLNCNISVLSKPQDDLKHYKVLRVIGSVMLVRDTERDCNRVIKTVQKPAGSGEYLSDYILRGKIPFMVRLYGCIETESTIFLILQHASGGNLWEYMKSYHKGRNVLSNCFEKGHTRSASCGAIIQKTEIKSNNAIKVQKRTYQEEVNLSIDPDESLRKLEEEFGAKSALRKASPTTDILAKSKELLRSVDATLKRSNSIASRLNESGKLLYCENSSEYESNSNQSNNIEAEQTSSEKLGVTRHEVRNQADKVSLNSNRNLSSISSEASFESSHLLSSQESQFPDSEKEKGEVNSVGGSKNSSQESDEILNSDQFQSLVAEDSGIEMDDELWKLPEGTIRFWAAEILVTLESLHQQDVIVGDLKPDHILLGSGGHIAMSYIVPRRSFQFLRLRRPYSAPELCIFSPTAPPTTAADLWSYGVLLYELFTGIQFQSKHPGPFHSHSILNIPEELSSNVKSLISGVLRYRPEERLTIPQVKNHPFFVSIDWTSLVNSCFT